MIKSRAGNNKFLKKYNQTGVLDLIRINKAVSRVELSGLTGLSPTAIGSITSDLMENGYIREMGAGRSKGGRRPVLLELKPHSFYSAGVDIDVDGIRIVLIDITGETVWENFLDICSPFDVNTVVSNIGKEIARFVGSHGIENTKMLGVGVSVPGMVSGETGEIVLAPNLGWENEDIGKPLADLLHIPVSVENEAMASAICENWLGTCQGINNFVCINIKTGVGAGIFTGGKPYKGASGCAGEVGHIVVAENGPKCGCGNYGCLETMASTGCIAENARRLVRQGMVSKLNDYSNVDDIGIEQVITAARAGDEASRNILLESARYMGIAVSNIVNTLNPDKVIIGKEFVKYADLVMDCITGVVKCKALKPSASSVDISASVIGEKTSALGAAIIPLKALFGR